jgi:hypothetical protein
MTTRVHSASSPDRMIMPQSESVGTDVGGTTAPVTRPEVISRMGLAGAKHVALLQLDSDPLMVGVGPSVMFTLPPASVKAEAKGKYRAGNPV